MNSVTDVVITMKRQIKQMAEDGLLKNNTSRRVGVTRVKGALPKGTALVAERR
jgi:hypothetical protein